MRIFFPIPEKMPDSRARFNQVMGACAGLVEAGAEVVLLTGLKPKTSVHDLLAAYGLGSSAGIKIVNLPMLRGEAGNKIRISWHGLFHIALLLYLFFKSDKKNPSVIFIRHLKLAGFLLRFKKLLKLPIIFEIHEMFYLTATNKTKAEKLKELERSVYSNVDALICTTDALKSAALELITKPVPTTVIRHMVKKSWLNQGGEKSGSHLLYIGSFYKYKGVDTLIEAMVDLPNEKLLIVGGGERLDELIAKTKTLGITDRVEFAGEAPHSRIPEFLSRAKISILPNILEGMSHFTSPLKMYEAMAFGLPLVASNIPALTEVLVDDHNAVLFEPGSSQSLADAIRQLSGDAGKAARIAAQAKKDAEKYTHEAGAKEIVKIMAELAAGNN